jgi:hypothetical protein
MRKRRVGVTARSRGIVEDQATGSPQIDAEMAAPLELRTPKSTVARATMGVRMEAWRQRRGSQAAEDQSEEELGYRERVGRDRAPTARMRRCLILRQGASPLRPRPPFPSAVFYGSQGIRQGFASRAQIRGAPLTDYLASERVFAEIRERGPLDYGACPCLPLLGLEPNVDRRPQTRRMSACT